MKNFLFFVGMEHAFSSSFTVRMRYLMSISFCLVCATIFLHAQQKKSPIILLNGTQHTQQEQTQRIERIVNSARLTGLSVVIINDNRVVYDRAFGLRNSQAKAPLHDTTAMYAERWRLCPTKIVLFLPFLHVGNLYFCVQATTQSQLSEHVLTEQVSA